MLGLSQLHSDLCSLSWELASFLFPLTSLCKPRTTIIRPQSHDIMASLHAHGRAGLRSRLTTDTTHSVPSSNQLHSCRSWEEQKWIRRFQSATFPNTALPKLWANRCTTVKNVMQLRCGLKGIFKTKTTLSVRAPALPLMQLKSGNRCFIKCFTGQSMRSVHFCLFQHIYVIFVGKQTLRECEGNIQN